MEKQIQTLDQMIMSHGFYHCVTGAQVNVPSFDKCSSLFEAVQILYSKDLSKSTMLRLKRNAEMEKQIQTLDQIILSHRFNQCVTGAQVVLTCLPLINALAYFENAQFFYSKGSLQKHNFKIEEKC
jgi:hypothetical protein